MPRDTFFLEPAPVEIVPHPFAEEIAILDRMRKRLATSARWCQFHELRGRSMCLIGAWRRVSAVEDARFKVLDALSYMVSRQNAPDRFLNITNFNDALSRKHPDILALIARTRRRFVDRGAAT